jgi:hypothetical protein
MKVGIDRKYLSRKFWNPLESRYTAIRIEPAEDCDGVDCGLTSDNGDEWPSIQPPHWHLVLTGTYPSAGPRLRRLWRPLS